MKLRKKTNLDRNLSGLPTWSQYCQKIGSSKTVINEWLKRWFPNEKKPTELLPDPIFSEKWFVELGDIQTYQTDKKFDFIITDPPYPKGGIWKSKGLWSREAS